MYTPTSLPVADTVVFSPDSFLSFFSLTLAVCPSPFVCTVAFSGPHHQFSLVYGTKIAGSAYPHSEKQETWKFMLQLTNDCSMLIYESLVPSSVA